MKIKIGVTFVLIVLIISISTVEAIHNINEDETPSSGLANITQTYEQTEIEMKNYIGKINDKSLPFYGYNTWKTEELVQGPVSFNPATPGIIDQIAPTTSNSFISGATWALGKWYGCEFSLGEGDPFIWTINTVIGEMSVIGSYDTEETNLSFNGLAYDYISGKMYGCSNTALYRVNMNTGASSFVGNFGISDGVMIAITFDESGNLYGTELTTDCLYLINTLNGKATKVGNGLGIDINFAQDMAFDIDNEILYLSAYTISPVKEGALYTCNKFTGVAEKVGTFQEAAEITGFAIPYCGIPQINPSTISGGILRIGESKIKASVKNIGGLPCTNVTLKIATKRSIILSVGSKEIIPTLNPGETVEVSTSMLIGFGFLTKTLIVTVTESSCGKTESIPKNALMFGLLWAC